jgi:hypothetical protein
MRNFKKTLIITGILSVSTITLAIFIQLNAIKQISPCSYLDPIIIDILAFILSLFLIIEGFSKIISQKNLKVKKQLTRIIRISFGFAILTLHTIQFIHK